MRRSSLIWALMALLALVIFGCDENQNPPDGESNFTGNGQVGSTSPSSSAVDRSIRPGDDALVPPASNAKDDDDDTTIPDEEYPSLLCPLPDPEGLGSGVLFGGGSFTGTVTVYVYDDETCLPLAGAAVRFTDTAVYADDAGKAVLTGVPPDAIISAHKNEYWTCGYRAAAAVMYFRLHPNYDILFTDYTDSVPGRFTSRDQYLEMTGPQSLEEALLNPAYIGFASVGWAREAALSSRKYLTAQAEFEFNFVNPDEIIQSIWPANLYVPDISVVFNIPGYGDLGFYGSHEEFQVPVHPGATEMAMQAVIAGLNTGRVMDEETLLAVIQAVLNGGDFLEIILPFVKPLLNEAISFPFVGARPSWLLDGPPDIPVYGADSGKKHVKVEITNPNPDFDYVELLWADIPNRALMPMALQTYEGQTVHLPYAAIPDADYLVTSVKTDLLSSQVYSSLFSIAVKYVDDLTEWDGGLAFDDADFLPAFNPLGTYYDTDAGELVWDIDGPGADRIDMFWVGWLTWTTNESDMILLTLPSQARYLNFHDILPGLHTCSYDTIFLLAVDLPFDYDDGFDPSRLFGYDLPAFSMWIYPDPAETIRSYF